MSAGKLLDLSVYEDYAGKLVARMDDRIIESASTLEELLSKLKKKGIDPRYVLIDYIPEEPLYYLI